MPSPVLTFEVENLKALRTLKWTPSGVSVLVGPNGAGKSTALRLIELLRTALDAGLPAAMRVLGGGPLRHFDARSVPTIRVSQGVDVFWEVVLDPNDPSEIAGEGEARVQRSKDARGSMQIRLSSSHTRALQARDEEVTMSAIRSAADVVPRLFELSDHLRGSAFYARPELAFLRESLSADSNEVTLSRDAKNLFTVLKNWRLNSDFADRYDFVVGALSELFEDFRTLDFPQAGQRTSASMVRRFGREKLQPTDWSDGFFCCLSMLTALASVKGGIAAVDEPENSLHPELIRRMVELMREWSRAQRTTVLLASHSPVLLNEFRDEPERVFVMQPGHEELPVPLDQLKKRDWLQHFSLGDLYAQNEVGASTHQ